MKNYESARVGDRVVVRGVECVVYAVVPAGTVEVEAVDGSGRCWRVSGGIVRTPRDV